MKQNILIITACLDIGGAEKVARDIALFGDRTKYNYHYAVFGEKIGAYEQELESVGCRIFHLDSPKRGYLRYLRALIGLIRQHHYRAVHVHTMFSSGWAMLAARLCGVPIRVTHAHSALDDGSSLVKNLYEGAMRQLILSCSTDLVACGVAAGIRLYGRGPWDRRGTLILNGIDTDRFRFRQEERDRIRRELGLENAFVLGHAGHMAPVKNQKFLLELMPRLLELRPNTRLLLLGDGADRPMLLETAQTLGIADRVILTGNVSDPAGYLSAMDVFVFPSLYEGTPLAILEAQTNGLPCIMSTGVPRDVHLTDLICPLDLSEPSDAWVRAICDRKPGDRIAYSEQMRELGLDTARAMDRMHRIYERN